MKRWELLRKVTEKKLTLAAVTPALGISYRQAQRLKAKAAAQGVRGLSHGNAGLADYVPSDPRNFPDVPDTFWAYKHIEYCVENGVVNGYGDGYYYPDIIVTRDQMAVYIARAFELL